VGDGTVIAAVVAGAVAGLLLMRWASAADRSASMPTADAPAAGEPPAAATGYRREPGHSAAPVLLAVGVALLGTGLAVGSGDGGIDGRAVIPGLAVLVAALVAARRGSPSR